jgi:hypothetical protein
MIITLYHGSVCLVEKPEYGKGNPHNDYGLGFYCTEDIELAKEWACPTRRSGVANIYTLDTSDMHILSLLQEQYNVLHWLAILINNRTFAISSQIAADAKEYLSEFFLPEIAEYDVIKGWRADDSYFAFASDFLNNGISLKQLSRAMGFGNLGEQFVLKSRKAFDLLQFAGSEEADSGIYFERRARRDIEARQNYLQKERHRGRIEKELFMIDILREEMKPQDVRLQRKLS